MPGGRSHDAGGFPLNFLEGEVPGEISPADPKASASSGASLRKSSALRNVNMTTALGRRTLGNRLALTV